MFHCARTQGPARAMPEAGGQMCEGDLFGRWRRNGEQRTVPGGHPSPVIANVARVIAVLSRAPIPATHLQKPASSMT